MPALLSLDNVILQDTAEVGVNCRTQLACEVLPAEAFNKSVAFSSSDENVAAVLDDGTVVGISAGEGCDNGVHG